MRLIDADEMIKNYEDEDDLYNEAGLYIDDVRGWMYYYCKLSGPVVDAVPVVKPTTVNARDNL